MKPENCIPRREFFKKSLLGGSTLVLVACGISPEKTQQIVIPSLTPSPSKTLIPETPQKTPDSKTPTLAYQAEDSETLKELRNAEGGEKLSLENALISYVVKIPRPFTSDAVYGVLAVNTPDGEKGAAIMDNSACLLKILEENELLKDPLGSEISPAISGLWRPNQRFEKIEGTVLVEGSIGAPIMITVTSCQYGENDPVAECPKNSIFSEAGELPRILAIESGKLIRELLEGFNEGYFE